MSSKRFLNKHELEEIRRNTDLEALVSALGIQKDLKKSKPHNIWAISPFSKNEKTPSFHINKVNGRWFCFSTNQGGSVLELVMEVLLKDRGLTLNSYQAANWLLENGISSLSGNPQTFSQPKVESPQNPSSEEKKNVGTKFDLVPFLSQQGTHPEFVRRGISKETCQYLGCGFLEKGSPSMQGRLVFQVRGLEQASDGTLKPLILSHIGRAITPEQETSFGRWCHYAGFRKTQELYNLDKVLLDEKAITQAKESKRVLIVEGCFDVAKLTEAKVFNVVATFGAHLDKKQIPHLKLISERLGIQEFFVWFDRDKAGIEGQIAALDMLKQSGLEGKGFPWNVRLTSLAAQKSVSIPPVIKDPCDFSVEQLRWLNSYKINK